MIQLHLKIERDHIGRGGETITPVDVFASTTPNTPPKFAGRLELVQAAFTGILLALLRGCDHIESSVNLSIELDGEPADLSLKPLVCPWNDEDDPWMYPTREGVDNAQRAALRDQRRRPLKIQQLLDECHANPERIEQLCQARQRSPRE